MDECGKTLLVTARCDKAIGHSGACNVRHGVRDEAAENLARAIAEPQIAAARREGVIEGLERALGMVRDPAQHALLTGAVQDSIKDEIERLRAEQKEG